MAFPIVKIGTLALKTFSKPIASRLKKQAGLHPTFREFIIGIAQVNHRFTTTVQRRIYGHATDVEIRPLNEEKAVHVASDLIGEIFIFMVAGAAVIFEVQRSARSEARKEEVRRKEMEVILAIMILYWFLVSSEEVRQREEALAEELDELKLKIVQLEKLARERSLPSFLPNVFTLRHIQAEPEKLAKPA